MSSVHLAVLMSGLTRMVAFVCITFAAVHFDSSKLLLLYLIPLCMGVSVEEGGKDDG